MYNTSLMAGLERLWGAFCMCYWKRRGWNRQQHGRVEIRMRGKKE